MATNPNIRSVTGATTIPAGVSKSGTFTVNATLTDRLTYSGTAAALDLILAQGRENPEQTKDNLWIYLVTAKKVFRVLSWGGQTVKIDGDATGVSADTWTLVESKLVGWAVGNVGDAAGTLKGVSLPEGANIAFDDASQATYRRRCLDAVTIDGTGTTLLVEEKL